MEIDIEEYLNYRETAFAALCNNDLKGAKNNIRMAFKIYPNDPDLLCMNGEYNIRMSDRKSAFKYFKAAILVNPDDNNIYLYQAQIMFNFFEYNGAIRACRILLKKNNNELEVRTLLGKCYFHSKKWHRASRIFLENYRKAPNDFETRRYLSRLADRLRRVLPVRFIAKRDLKKIYRVLGEYNNLKKVKIAPRQIILLLLWIILACICFKVWISGKSYSIIVLFLAQIIYYFVKKKLKR
jgi:predicted Zn-dependent protease